MHRAAPALRHPRRLACLALTMTLWPWGAALAQGPAPRVYTRAVVRELPAEGGTLLSLVITYPDAETRDAVLGTGMTEGMEASYARLEDEVLQTV